MISKTTLLLLFLVLLGASLRIFGLYWDWGFHLHPDERAIVLYTLPLQFPQTFTQVFSTTSPWNPHFFAYGSFPIYLLKIVGSFSAMINSSYNTYDGITLIGRIISACFDSLTILITYGIGKKIYNNKVGIIAASLYTFCVLPIQLSHFYAVDTILTFFTTLLIYQLLRFHENPRKKIAVSIGMLFGFALATKISAFVLTFSILLTIAIDFIYILLQNLHKPKHWFTPLLLFLKHIALHGILIIFSTILTFAILEPYAFIDFFSFYDQSMTQAQMTKNAFIFPYTLQYVDKTPYLYEIKNSILWGMGPFLGIMAWLGTTIYFIQLLTYNIRNQKKEIILASFFIVYFCIVGHFAVGFMRYMLPLYPILCLYAAWLCCQIFLFLQKKSPTSAIAIALLFFILSSIWTLSFMTIYVKQPTRVNASEWILRNIPQGKTIAIEHWDDALPLMKQENYTVNTLELYNPESTEKWQKIDEQITKSDYIILASNRLYVPLQKLTNCSSLPQFYCYTQTAQYYKKLFNGSLGFKKVADFTVYPTIPLLQIPINDQQADESFTVYDHPRVLIFQKKQK